jgi:hypothetical protein
MKRAYSFLLLLYPREHRDQFAEEMTSVFEEARSDGRHQGWAWYVRFAFAEITGLIAGAAGCWFGRRPAPEAGIANGPECTVPQELVEAQQRVDRNMAGMVHAIANRQYERARTHSDQERQAREQLRLLEKKYGITG